MYYFLVTVCYLLPFVSNSQIVNPGNSHVTTIRLDPTYAKGADLSEVATRLEYIPLQTTKNSYFGKIDRLEVVNGNFIIYDRETDAILIFNAQGRFISKIKKIPGIELNKTHRSFGNFSIDRSGKKILIFLYSNNRIPYLAYFDLSGNFITVTGCANTPFVEANEFYALVNSNFALAKHNDQKNDSAKRHYQLTLFDHKNNTINKLFPFNPNEDISGYDYISGNNMLYYHNDTSAFYVKPYQYNAYKIGPNSAQLLYTFIFPFKSTLPSTFFTDGSLEGKRGDYLKKNGALISHITNFYALPSSLIFKLETKVPSYYGPGNSYLHSLNSGETIGLYNLTPGPMSYYLPVFGDMNEVQAVEHNVVYSSFPSYFLLEAKKNNTKANSLKYPNALSEFFKQGTPKENPVILKMTIKEHL